MNTIVQKVYESIHIFYNTMNPIPKYKFEILNIQKDIYGSNDWDRWSRYTGVYVFIWDNKVQLIGSASNNTLLGNEIEKQIKRNNKMNVKWFKILNAEDSNILLIIFENAKDEHCINDLEGYLAGNLKPIWDYSR